MVKRNDKCPCGSGLKYKKCCIDNDIEEVDDDQFSVPILVLNIENVQVKEEWYKRVYFIVSDDDHIMNKIYTYDFLPYNLYLPLMLDNSFVAKINYEALSYIMDTSYREPVDESLIKLEFVREVVFERIIPELSEGIID